jgi:hypothetical protein
VAGRRFELRAPLSAISERHPRGLLVCEQHGMALEPDFLAHCGAVHGSCLLAAL